MWKNNSDLQPPTSSGWLDYNHCYVFGKSLHQQEYKFLKKGLDAGLSKEQISNLINNQGADFYDDCQDIPDPPALGPMQNNLLLLDVCFLCKQKKAESYYTRVDIIIVM